MTRGKIDGAVNRLIYPEGITAVSPACAMEERYAGEAFPQISPTLKGLNEMFWQSDATLSGLMIGFAVTQGSSCLATLG
jgi:hypothetical protein